MKIAASLPTAKDSARLEPLRTGRRYSTIKQIVIVVGAQGGLGVCGFATGTIAARLLGPAARGELAAIQLFGSLFATFATLGLSEATTLFSARDPGNARSHVCSAMLLSAIIGAPILYLSYLAVPYLLSAQSAIVIRSCQWYLLILLFYISFSFPHCALRGLGDFTVWSALRYLTPGASLIALYAAWLTGRISPQFIALFGLVTLGVLSLPFALYIMFRRISGPWRPHPTSWIPMLSFSLPLVGSALPKQLNLRLDQMVMAALLPPRLLGLYAVAAAWSSLPAPILEGVGAFLFPHVAAHDSAEVQARALLQVTRLATPLALIEVFVCCLLTPWGLTKVFGEPYRESIPSALILMVAGTTLYLGELLEQGLRGLGKPMPILWAELGGLLITGLALAALLRPLSIVGAAIASLLGYTMVWSILVANIRSATGFSLADILVPSRSEIRKFWELASLS